MNRFPFLDDESLPHRFTDHTEYYTDDDDTIMEWYSAVFCTIPMVITASPGLGFPTAAAAGGQLTFLDLLP